MIPVDHTPYEELPEVRAVMAAHGVRWVEYEQGLAWTRSGAQRAGRRRLRWLREADAPWAT